MDQAQIDGLVGGEHTDLHHHDQRYDLRYLQLTGGTLTGNLTIAKDQPAIILEDDGGYVAQLVNTDITTQLFLDPTDAVANSGLDIYVDGISPSLHRILQLAADTINIEANLVITDHYLQIKGDEGADGYIYLYADDGDDPTSDFWRIRAGDDGLFAIQNWPVSGWVDIFTIDPSVPSVSIIDAGLGIIRSANDALTNLTLNNANSGSLNQTYIRCEAQNNSITMASFSDAYGSPFGNAGAIYTGAAQDLLLGTAGGWNMAIHHTTGIVHMPGGITIDDALVIDSILDQDDFYSDSDTALATQQSIKAYVDSEISDLTTYVDDKSYLDLGSILTSNGSYTGTKISVTVDDASTVFGNVLAQAADFNYDRADADAATSSVGLVLALSSCSGSKEVLIEGMACNTSWTWSAGLLYLSTTTGAMTQTAPSGTGDQVVAVGWALSATCIYFKPSLVLVEVA